MLRLCHTVRRKPNLLVPISLLCLTQLRRLQASGCGGIPQRSPPPVRSFLRATPAGVLALPGGTRPPHQGRRNTEECRNTSRPLILVAPQWSPRPIAPASHHTFSAHCSTETAPTRWTGTCWVGSALGAHLHATTSTAAHLIKRAYVHRCPPDWDSQLGTFIRKPLWFLTSQAR